MFNVFLTLRDGLVHNGMHFKCILWGREREAAQLWAKAGKSLVGYLLGYTLDPDYN